MFFNPNLVVGLTIMAVGAALLLDVLGIRDAASLMKFWPALIVLFGASIVAQAFRPVDPATAKKSGNGGVPCVLLFLRGVAMFWTFGFPASLETRAEGRRVSATGVMGRAEARNVGSDVRSARVAAVMGRSSLDLRQVQLAPGEDVVVDVFVTMGRATIRIPDHWVVDASALPVMGSVDEERFTPITPETASEPTAEKEEPLAEKDDQAAKRDATVAPPAPLAPPPATGPAPRLRLRGFVMMGKVEVTS